MREAFELWAKRCNHNLHRLENYPGLYANSETRSAWEVWQAALSHKQKAQSESDVYEAVGGVFYIGGKADRRIYPNATFSTTDLQEGEILYVKRK